MTQNNTTNKLEQIRQALNVIEAVMCHEVCSSMDSKIANSGIICREKISTILATLDTLIADCSAVDVEKLEEAVEFRREIAEFAIDRVKNFYGMNKDKPELSPDAFLWIAARAYLELQGGK